MLTHNLVRVNSKVKPGRITGARHTQFNTLDEVVHIRIHKQYLLSQAIYLSLCPRSAGTLDQPSGVTFHKSLNQPNALAHYSNALFAILKAI